MPPYVLYVALIHPHIIHIQLFNALKYQFAFTNMTCNQIGTFHHPLGTKVSPHYPNMSGVLAKHADLLVC